MIKVKRNEKPQELTEELEKKLTEEFKNNSKKDVWNKSFIRKALLSQCHNKCVYCESRIGEENSKMEIDHYHCKSRYPDEVVKWENLFPACSHCNSNKSSHDTCVAPIINPFEDDPKDYFYIKSFRYYCKDETYESKVTRTIEVLGLNDTNKLVKYRFELVSVILGELEELYFDLQDTEIGNDIRKKNRKLKKLKEILSTGQNTEKYSVFVATAIKEDEYYNKIKNILKSFEIWDEELKKLDEGLEEVRLATCKNNNKN